jgi:hypothetical protein
MKKFEFKCFASLIYNHKLNNVLTFIHPLYNFWFRDSQEQVLSINKDSLNIHNIQASLIHIILFNPHLILLNSMIHNLQVRKLRENSWRS